MKFIVVKEIGMGEMPRISGVYRWPDGTMFFVSSEWTSIQRLHSGAGIETIEAQIVLDPSGWSRQKRKLTGEIG